jgi:hypothetical protein
MAKHGESLPEFNVPGVVNIMANDNEGRKDCQEEYQAGESTNPFHDAV